MQGNAVSPPSRLRLWGGAFILLTTLVVLVADGADGVTWGLVLLSLHLLAEEAAARMAVGPRRTAVRAASQLLALLAFGWALLHVAERFGVLDGPFG